MRQPQEQKSKQKCAANSRQGERRRVLLKQTNRPSSGLRRSPSGESGSLRQGKMKSEIVATAAAKPGSIASKKRKSCTAILCELTRLKSQQKYLECSQLKLVADNFQDCGAVDAAPVCNNSVSSVIGEIEHLKIELEEELSTYRRQLQQDVQELCALVRGLKEAVLEPERLQELALSAMREHIVDINSKLEGLHSRNANELQSLQQNYSKLEKEAEILIK